MVIIKPNELPTPMPPKSGALPYVIALVILSLIGALSIVLVTLARPHEDNTAIYTQIVGMLVPTSAAILALIKVNQTSEAVQNVHISLNSRLTQLLEQTELASRAKGKADAITDAAAASAITSSAADKIDKAAVAAAASVAAAAAIAALKLTTQADVIAKLPEAQKK
jgi:hypothetical protein